MTTPSVPYATQENSVSQAGSAQIDVDSLTVERRAIESFEEAWELVKRLQEENRDRNLKNARIMAKYNAEAPNKQSDLKRDGLDWMSNFSTKPLAVLIDKIAPRFTKALHSARYLTASKLPETVQNAAEKTAAFRRKTTELVRSWPGWRPCAAQIAQENGLFGYAAAIHTDEYDWRPNFFRQDEFFVPQGTKQTADSISILVATETYLVHEAYQLIKDQSAAKTAGWQVEEMAAAINAAKPQGTNTGNGSEESRRQEDLVRETALYHSFAKGANVIIFAHVFATEVDGTVSHWIVDGRSGKGLFRRHDRFENMQQVITLFTFQQGNGTVHGSKGIGREVYNMASALDRARNEVVNRLQLSGKIVIKSDEKMIRRFKASIVGPAILIDKNYEIAQTQIEAAVEPFFQLDQYLVRLLDEIAGGTTPREFAGERVTKAAVELFASREEEKRDVLIERYLVQNGDLMSEIQRRAWHPQCTEPTAQRMRNELLQVMSEEELEYLRTQPAIQSVEDFTQTQEQNIVLFADSKRQDPLYNQAKLQKRAATAQFGEEFANDVILDENDPTEVAEQTNKQLLESLAISFGKDMPVSPRDNHRVHLDAMRDDLVNGATALVQAPEKALPIMKRFLAHAEAHINTAVQGGAKATEFAEDIQALKTLAKQAGEVEAQLAATQPQQEQPIAA